MPVEVMKISKILHFKQSHEFGLYVIAFSQVGSDEDKIIHIEQNAHQPVATLPDEK